VLTSGVDDTICHNTATPGHGAGAPMYHATTAKLENLRVLMMN
jgi:hypothetical protein